MLRSIRLLAAALPAFLWVLAACSGGETQPETPATLSTDGMVQSSAIRSFAFPLVDGGMITSGALRGRMTVVALAATYDTASQAQARFLNAVVMRYKPRINAVLLVLEPAHHAPLVQAFAASLNLRYPVAIADKDTIAGKGPFPGLHHVPSLVLLDRQGREVWRQLGVCGRQDPVGCDRPARRRAGLSSRPRQRRMSVA